MRINGLVAAGLAALGLTLAWSPGTPTAGAATSAGGVTRAPMGAEEIAPYSRHPAETRPYAVCPPPTKRRASCMAAAVPTEGGEPVVGPSLEGSGMLGGFSPADLRSAYGLPGGGGAGMTIAITIAYDDPQAEADLAAYRSHYGLPACTTANGCFAKVNQLGEAGNYPVPDSGWALETSLDLDMVSAACPACDIVLVEADSNEFEDMALAVDRAAALGADVISNSWATEEFSGEATQDHHFAHPGIPALFASGDSGYGVSYPAASPGAIAVGGTGLYKSADPRGWEEAAWSGAGSGCSAYEAKPSWQKDGGCPNRTVADVSAVADPQTPVSVYDSFGHTGWVLLGGTSVATPLVAAVEAHSSGAFRTAGPSAFARAGNGGRLFDVTEGENGSCGVENDYGFDATYLCQAEAGYDGPTGWGTPNGPQSLPVALTEEATAGSTEGATLHGSVDPRGLSTSYRFEYGETTAYGHSVPVPNQGVGSGFGYVAVSQPIDGLQGRTLYHYRIVASNSGGTFPGVDRTFGTSPPWVSTGLATEVHAFDANLGATVNPEGLETSYYFEYGLTTAYGAKAPARAGTIGPGLADVSVSAFVNGLGAGKTYHFRVVAKNSAGKSYGADRFLITEPSHWSAETLPQPPESGYGHEAFGVSCVEPDDCVAVGGNWSLEVHTRVTLAERWDGSSWSVMDTPNPPGLDEGWQHNWYAVLTDVSCVSASDCLAVGRYRDSGEALKPLAEHWDGSQWTLLSVAVPGGAAAAALEGVSCAAATTCVAVGYLEDASGVVKPLAEGWDGSAWTVEPTPSPSGSPPASWLEGVSCSAPTACTAVGIYETSAQVEKTLAERWDGAAWTLQATKNPTGNQAWNELKAVSCASATACTAVGRHVEKVGSDFTPSALAERWDGIEWTAQATPQPPLSEGSSLLGVSCASATACTAVGSYEAVAGADSYAEVLGERWDGTNWSILGMVGLSYPAGWWHERWLYGVSCPEAEGCNAVGAGLAAPEGELSAYKALGEHEARPPFASFTTAPDEPLKGESVAFDASSTIDPGHTIESYEWDFGDGEQGTGAAPSHAYAQAGDYAATLTVTDDEGKTGEISHLVSIGGAPPQPAFTFEPTSPTATEDVAFDGSSSSDPDGTIESYEWDFGDGAHATGATASHAYADPGSYHVTLTVIDDEGGSAEASHLVVVSDAPPQPAFTIGTSSPTATQPVAFDGSASSDPDGSIATYSWNFGDGDGATGATPSHTFAHAGEYTVTLEVTDDEGGTAEISHLVSVAGVTPVAAFTVSTASPTAAQPVVFDGSTSLDSDGSIAAYGWDFGDGRAGAGSTPAHAFAHPGEYTVTLTVTDDEGGTAEVSHSVSVAPAPPGSLNVRRVAAGCNGKIVLLLHAPADGRVDAVATANVMEFRRSGRGGKFRRARDCHASRPSGTSHRIGRRRFAYGTDSAAVARDGDVRLAIAPSDSSLRALRRSGRLRVAISITFRPRGGEPQTVHRSLVVHP
jgi:PKD repeat protein